MSFSKRVTFQIDAQDNATDKLKKINSELKSVSSSAVSLANKGFSELQSMGGKLALALAGATAGLGLLGKKMVDSTAKMEQNRIAFETMLGSADEARNMLSKLSQFAEKTPFNLPEVVEGSQRLLAMGISAEKILPTFTNLGNIASGVGKEKLGQLILAFGQVKAATYLTGAELRQFTEAGVPLLDQLAKQSGKTASQIKEGMEKGARIPFSEVEKALNTLTGDGGKFFNLMEKQSKSFGGVLSNTSDAFGRISRQVLGMDSEGNIRDGSIFFYLKKGAEGFLQFIERNKDKFVAFVDNLIVKVKEIAPKIIAFAKPIFDFFVQFLSNAQNMKATLIGVFGPIAIAIGSWAVTFLPVIALFAALSLAIGTLYTAWTQNWGGIRDTTQAVLTWLQTVYEIYLLPFFEKIKAGMSGFVIVWNTYWELAKAYFQSFWTILLGILQISWSLISGFVLTALAIFQGNWGLAWENIKAMTLGIWEGIKNIIIGVLTLILNIVKTVVSTIGVVWNAGWSIILGAASRFGNAIKTAIVSPIQSIVGVVSGIISSIVSMIDKAISKIKSLSDKAKDSGSKKKKATGGNVMAGQSYMVGERGPEMFVPKQSGSIIPNNRLGNGGSSVSNTFNFSFNGSFTNKQQLIDEITYAINRQLELSRNGIG